VLIPYTGDIKKTSFVIGLFVVIESVNQLKSYELKLCESLRITDDPLMRA